VAVRAGGELGDGALTDHVLDVVADIAGALVVYDLLPRSDVDLLLLPWTWRGEPVVGAMPTPNAVPKAASAGAAAPAGAANAAPVAPNAPPVAPASRPGAAGPPPVETGLKSERRWASEFLAATPVTFVNPPVAPTIAPPVSEPIAPPVAPAPSPAPAMPAETVVAAASPPPVEPASVPAQQAASGAASGPPTIAPLVVPPQPTPPVVRPIEVAPAPVAAIAGAAVAAGDAPDRIPIDDLGRSPWRVAAPATGKAAVLSSRLAGGSGGSGGAGAGGAGAGGASGAAAGAGGAAGTAGAAGAAGAVGAAAASTPLWIPAVVAFVGLVAVGGALAIFSRPPSDQGIAAATNGASATPGSVAIGGDQTSGPTDVLPTGSEPAATPTGEPIPTPTLAPGATPQPTHLGPPPGPTPPDSTPTPPPSATPTPAPTPTAAPTPTPSPSPTSAPTDTPAPGMCVVITLINHQTSVAQGQWTAAGFTGTVIFNPVPPPGQPYHIKWQSLTVGSQVSCSSDITVRDSKP
jgi:hypothetical protein